MDSPISIRVATDAEDRPFPELTGPILLAEQDGSPLGAVELETGESAFVPRGSSGSLFTVLQLHRLEVRLIGALVGG
jgi:hypothetical protein